MVGRGLSPVELRDDGVDLLVGWLEAAVIFVPQSDFHDRVLTSGELRIDP